MLLQETTGKWVSTVAVQQGIDCFHARTLRGVEYHQSAPGAKKVPKVRIERHRLRLEGVRLQVERGRIQQYDHVELERKSRLLGVQLGVAAVDDAVPQFVEPRHVRPDEGSPLVHRHVAAHEQHRRLAWRRQGVGFDARPDRRAKQDHREQNRAMHQVSFPVSVAGLVFMSSPATVSRVTFLVALMKNSTNVFNVSESCEPAGCCTSRD